MSKSIIDWLRAVADTNAAKREAEYWRLESCRELERRQKLEREVQEADRMVADLGGELREKIARVALLEAEIRDYDRIPELIRRFPRTTAVNTLGGEA